MKNSLTLLVSFGLMSPVLASSDTQPDLAAVFDAFNATGTIVVVDERAPDNPTLVFNDERAAQRLSPASTFKIPHTLFALDAKSVRDEFQIFEWDGVERSFAAHNQDQDLRSAMRWSAVWVYQQFAEDIGTDRAQNYVKRIDYGNQSVTEGDYWLNGELTISAHEQIAFLKGLYANELPFAVEYQRLVKDILVVEAGRDWILRAKTGWDGDIGWWVGWVEWPTGPVFFALNIDTPERMDDLAKREDIPREILKAIGALPQ